MPIIDGTTGDDTLVGTPNDDTLNGGDGNDRLRGGAGNDTLNGGNGADFLEDEAGNDVLDGGAGDDFLYLYRLVDWIVGPPTQQVTLLGGDGNDRVVDWSYAYGSVAINAGAGDDNVALVSSSHDQTITLGAGRDVLDLDGLVAHWIRDTTRIVTDFQAGLGGDTLILYDLLSSYGQWDGQTDPFASGAVRLVQQGPNAVLQMFAELGLETHLVDLLVFENVSVDSFVADNFGGFAPLGVPSAGVDATGTAGTDQLHGGYGADVIDGAAGDDYIYGLAGDDTLRGGDGSDQIYSGYGDDIVEGGAGHDFLELHHDGGSDSVDGGTGNDFVSVYRNWRDVVEQITITTGDGADQVYYHNFDQGTVTVDLGTGGDRFTLLATRQDILLTLGSDADVVDFSQNYASLIGEMLVTITDFVPGQDVLQWGQYLRNELTGWNPRLDPFELGFTRFEQQGSDVVLLIDRDGAGSFYSEQPFLVLQNVSLAALGRADQPWIYTPADDFNGDGRSDILWRNDSGQIVNWLGDSDGGFAENGAHSFNWVSTDWSVAGVGDFNGDGRDDILWRRSNGQLVDWLGKAGGGFTDNGISSFNWVGTAWSVAGIGDFNGDGRDDILWRHNNGQMVDWLANANGGFADNSANSFNWVGTDWQVAGIGDFNGDGRDDILWRADNGRMVNWLGNAGGGFTQNGANAFNWVDTAWQVTGVGDFNGDGRDDILWRNVSNGHLVNWLANANGNGGYIENGANFFTAVGADWAVAAIGDYNGDGRDDILWHNVSTGQMVDWLANASGGFAENGANSFNWVGTDWQVQSNESLF